jgi:hypothetical protein
MDAHTFLKKAINPDEWLAKSATLRRSGDALWDRFFESIVHFAAATKDGGDANADHSSRAAADYFTSAKLLYGLALETAFKAYLLKHRPEDIEFKLSADGTGEVQTVEVKQFGVSMGSGHNLEHLAQRTGILTLAENPLFKHESDVRTAREIMRHLSEVVYWSGRYPVPTKSGDTHVLAEDVPPIALAHYIRDWTDPMLDHFQGPHAPPSSFEKR